MTLGLFRIGDIELIEIVAYINALNDSLSDNSHTRSTKAKTRQRAS